MPTLYQDDLFGGAPAVTEVIEPRPRRRRLASTTLDAGEKRPKSASQRERDRVHAEIKSNGAQGRTHHEIAERLGIPLQTVCWAVGKLLSLQEVFYPEIGWDTRRARATYLQRVGRKVLVDQLYRSTYPPPPESVAAKVEQLRSA